jgi:hypothetical protein
MSKEQHTLYPFGATITSCGDVAKGFRKEFRARAMKEGHPSTPKIDGIPIELQKEYSSVLITRDVPTQRDDKSTG